MFSKKEDKIKKYEIGFCKSRISVNGKIYCVKDSTIINALKSLQKIYYFEIISVDFSAYSSFMIKCRVKDKFDIFSDFCNKLSDYIESVEIKETK